MNPVSRFGGRILVQAVGLLKLLPIADEYTRECLALEVARSITAADVIRTLTRMEAAWGRILRPRRRGPKKKLMPTATDTCGSVFHPKSLDRLA